MDKTFPRETDWSITLTNKQEKNEAVLDYKTKIGNPVCETFFINAGSENTLTSLFIRKLWKKKKKKEAALAEPSSLKRHELGWEVTFLAELIDLAKKKKVDLAKHFEETLEKDKIKKANQFVALKL